MRVLVNISENQIKELTRISKVEKVSRAEVIRQAVEAYIEKKRRIAIGEAFGLWKEHNVEGLAYQERIRSEW
jgi:metal-responsive CopG/Arc/MetJ family transcriptional regulator